MIIQRLAPTLLTVCLLFFLFSSKAQIPESEKSLTIISYNIWNGFDWGKDETRHDLFVDWVQNQNPDVLALQELCGYTQEKLQEDAKAWGHPYAILLKEEGYPVGITSRQPIQLKEKVLKPFWHGMLHVETFGIDFFVVHFSPFDVYFRMQEARTLLPKIHAIDNEKYIVLGDFNALSPLDGDMNKIKASLLDRYRAADAKNEKYTNLRDQEFDYSVMGQFLGTPTVDVCHRFLSVTERYSYPAPILVGKYFDDSTHVAKNHQRIDYLMASPVLAKTCVSAAILHSDTTRRLSDHYPVKGVFRR